MIVLVPFGNEKFEKKLILYNNKIAIGMIAIRDKSIHRKNPLKKVDIVPNKINSIMQIM
jgi:hypothetical protein